MPCVLICARDPLMDDLLGTVLWRDDVARRVASSFHEALLIAVAARPDLVMIERALPQALRLLRDLRQEPSTRRVSIAVMIRGELELTDVELLQSGANAILRLPVGPEWNNRLSALLSVAPRRQSRLRLDAEFVAERGDDVRRLAGTALNVSTTGLLIESPVALELGTDLDIRFRLPGAAEEVVGCGRVVRLAGPDRYGLEFYALEGDGAARISAFVERAKRALHLGDD